MSREGTLRALRLATPTEQQRVAVQLAVLVEPFGRHASADERPSPSLAAVSEGLRQATNLVEVDALRRRLFDVPAMAGEEEPTGVAWYAYRAAVAWLYAADALCTAPGDGVMNTFTCVEDLLDAAEVELALTGLCDRLIAATSKAVKGDATALSALMGPVRQAAERVAVGF